jgi:UDP-glucose 4-epimerase
MLRAARSQSEPLTIFGDDYATPDGTCIRDYIHVTDLAEAHVSAFEHFGGVAGFSALNLGTGRGYSVKELITATQEVTGREVPHLFGRRREGDPPILVAETSLARRTLDWVPNNSDLRTILETAWKWSESLELGVPSRTPWAG